MDNSDKNSFIKKITNLSLTASLSLFLLLYFGFSFLIYYTFSCLYNDNFKTNSLYFDILLVFFAFLATVLIFLPTILSFIKQQDMTSLLKTQHDIFNSPTYHECTSAYDKYTDLYDKIIESSVGSLLQRLKIFLFYGFILLIITTSALFILSTYEYLVNNVFIAFFSFLFLFSIISGSYYSIYVLFIAPIDKENNKYTLPKKFADFSFIQKNTSLKLNNLLFLQFIPSDPQIPLRSEYHDIKFVSPLPLHNCKISAQLTAKNTPFSKYNLTLSEETFTAQQNINQISKIKFENTTIPLLPFLKTIAREIESRNDSKNFQEKKEPIPLQEYDRAFIDETIDIINCIYPYNGFIENHEQLINNLKKILTSSCFIPKAPPDRPKVSVITAHSVLLHEIDNPDKLMTLYQYLKFSTEYQMDIKITPLNDDCQKATTYTFHLNSDFKPNEIQKLDLNY